MVAPDAATSTSPIKPTARSTNTTVVARVFDWAGRAVSRALFLKEVWGGDQFVGDRTIDTHMLNLRQKIEPDPKQPRFLLTVHGVGYRLVEGVEA